MRVVNLLARFLIRSTPQNGSFMVDKGELKIYGADEATSAILQTEFPDLHVAPLASTSTASASGTNANVILSATHEEPIELDVALATITTYLNILDQQEFTVVSAFNDELVVGADSNSLHKYKTYMWTMQK